MNPSCRFENTTRLQFKITTTKIPQANCPVLELKQLIQYNSESNGPIYFQF